MDYVVISPEFLYLMANMIRSSIGAMFSVGIYITVILLGLFSLINLIYKIID